VPGETEPLSPTKICAQTLLPWRFPFEGMVPSLPLSGPRWLPPWLFRWPADVGRILFLAPPHDCQVRRWQDSWLTFFPLSETFPTVFPHDTRAWASAYLVILSSLHLNLRLRLTSAASHDAHDLEALLVQVSLSDHRDSHLLIGSSSGIFTGTGAYANLHHT